MTAGLVPAELVTAMLLTTPPPSATEPPDAGDVVGILVLVALVVVLLVAMRRAWRRRAATSAVEVPAPADAPAHGDVPTLLGPVAATYVTTSLAERPLERVVAHGLGERSAAEVEVRPDGVLVRRTGAPDVFVPVHDLVAAGTAGGMAGKFVGGEGLVVIRWHAPGGSVTLDTGLRTRRREERATLLDAVRALLPAPATTTGGPAQAPAPEEKP